MTIRIRRAQVDDAAAIARVHVAGWRSAYAGILPAEMLANLSVPRRESYWQGVLRGQAEIVFIAEADGKVVGFASGGPERDGTIRRRDQLPFDGELYAIYLLAAWTRQGIGEQLLRTFAGRLFEAGFHRMLVWVLSENQPARQFYERVGGVVESERTITIGEAEPLETSYGWDLPLA